MSSAANTMSDFIELVDELIRTAHKLGEEETGHFYNHETQQDKEYLSKLRVETIDYWRESSNYPLAPVSSTLDRLLEYFDPADTKRRTDLAEADLGEIEHKGEKVTVKIKVVRGE